MWRRTFERRGTYIFISESVLVTIFATRKISPVFAWRLYLEADGFQHGSADVLSGNVQYDIKVQFGKTEIICLNIHICFNGDNFSQPWQMISFRSEGSVIATLLYVLSCRTRFPLHRTWERATQEFGVKKTKKKTSPPPVRGEESGKCWNKINSTSPFHLSENSLKPSKVRN